MKQNTFFNLGSVPTIENNYSSYFDALDYVFENDVKNIAISGIYGSGKSTIWQEYLKDRNINNKSIVSISISKYEDNEEGINENVIEKRIINQIIFQIRSKYIPLSKYEIKENKIWITIFNSFFSVSFFISMIFWMLLLNNKIFSYMFENIYLNITFWSINPLISYLSLFWFFFTSFRKKKFNHLKIKLKNIETINLKNEDTISDINNEMIELVYMLKSSKIKAIVFEDLDRFENINLFVKLKELNYALNRNKNNVIRFFYLLKDDLIQNAEERTKFFDFIIPIIPVINSNNSKDVIKNLFKQLGIQKNKKPNEQLMIDICHFIKDMRLLKNIINEYIIILRAINTGKFKLNIDKLFTIVVIKNVFPKEYDLMLNNDGFIAEKFSQIKELNEKINEYLKRKKRNIEAEIQYLKDTISKNIFETICLKIPSSLYVIKSEMDDFFIVDPSWLLILEEWKKQPNKKLTISDRNSVKEEFDFNSFISYATKNFISHNDRIVFDENNKSQRIKKLENEIKKINEDLQRQKNFKQILNQANDLKFDTSSVFSPSLSFTHIIKKDIKLIELLISKGLVDETYWHYIGYTYEI